MDIEKQKLQDDLDAERRVSYAMACALGEISEALGMDENEAGTLQAVKELLKNLKDAEFKSEQFKSDAESLRAELQKARDQKPYGYLLEHSDGAEFYNMEISANFNCTDKVQASVMPVYAAPVTAMPIQDDKSITVEDLAKSLALKHFNENLGKYESVHESSEWVEKWFSDFIDEAFYIRSCLDLVMGDSNEG